MRFTMEEVLARKSPGITNTTFKYVLGKMYDTGREAIDIVNEEDLWQIGRDNGRKEYFRFSG